MKHASYVCDKYKSSYVPVLSSDIVGVARNVASAMEPLNALRHNVTKDATGWYVWAGEHYSQDPDFFEPMHINHLIELRPEIEQFLALEPGWRLLLNKKQAYEDVWFDANLKKVGD